METGFELEAAENNAAPFYQFLREMPANYAQKS
jgi:hypothetical protein